MDEAPDVVVSPAGMVTYGRGPSDVPHFSLRLCRGLTCGWSGLCGLGVGGGGDAEEVQDLELEFGELGFEDLDEVPGGGAGVVPGDVREDLEDPVGGWGGAAAQLGIDGDLRDLGCFHRHPDLPLDSDGTAIL